MNNRIAPTTDMGIYVGIFFIVFLLTLFIYEIQLPANFYRFSLLLSLPILAHVFIFWNEKEFPISLSLNGRELIVLLFFSLTVGIFVYSLASSFLPFFRWLSAVLGFLWSSILVVHLWK